MEADRIRTKRLGTLAVWAVVLVAVCVGVSYVVTGLMVKGGNSWEHDEEHGHHWLHQELALNPEEIALVDGFEPDYRRDRAKLLADFNGQIAKLRELLVSQDRFSPEVNAAIHELHGVHAALQELSIRHYYDMMSVLPPEKKEKLRKLAVEALSEPE
ncbi:periplasmic heavy metal sensor [Pelagicoccus sp. SDUM812005]|uniref:periplasmic heavy metal sensor n=1 Tax=Pelagicoccus sp. SDUM812005 TaxID=3041257 RepID=UPI00280DD82D|nr:periplasmic heavy metal sensor [Pelagicoccus sp. SDUM812005]MDQ8180524.1 periplasmic heavy metal sensor [Pelagicoccus sp. SDUM812005]